MSDEALLHWLPYVIPFFFAGMWLIITTMLGFMSGWFNLQQWYDAPSQEPLPKLRGQSGSMGFGVALNSVLRLAAYRSGLGIGISRIFGPFQKPFMLPSSEIEAQPGKTFFTPMVKLSLGKPAVGSLKISARSWSRLVEAVPKDGADRQVQMPSVPSVSSGSLARGMFLEWLVITAVAGTLFCVVSRPNPGFPGLPFDICYGLPAVALGVGQLIRFARQG